MSHYAGEYGIFFYYESIPGEETFSSCDYTAPTPHWAVYGANERGFDPLEKRWYRKGKREENVDGGCG